MQQILIGIVALLLSTTAVADQDKRILVDGDSNTWGWKPVVEGYPTTKYQDSKRWAGVMQSVLGNDYQVIVNGLVGRTTDLESSAVGLVEGRDFSGLSTLGETLASQSPLDLVVVMLGTNDLQTAYQRSPEDVAVSLVNIARQIEDSTNILYTTYEAPRVLLIAPPAYGDTTSTPLTGLFAAGEEPSKALGPAIVRAANAAGIAVFDAGTVIETDGVDGVHFTVETHRTLGRAIAKHTTQILN